MISLPLLKTTSIVLVLSVSLLISGCVSTTYVQTDNFRECEDHPVKILTPGGSEYRIGRWSDQDSCIVVREGEVHRASTKPGFWGKVFEPFSGDIPRDSIAQCFCAETDAAGTAAGNILLFLIAAPLVVVLFMAVTGTKFPG